MKRISLLFLVALAVPAALNAFESKRKVDVLFVVDDSGSMGVHQQNLAKHVSRFISSLSSWSEIDYQIGVVTTDMKSRYRMGKLFGFPKFVTPETPDLTDALKFKLLPGTNGDVTEKLMDPVLSSFKSPEAKAYNEGFHRSDSELAIIFVSDAEEQSHTSVDRVLAELTAFKGEGNLHFYVIGSFPGTNCPKDEENDPQHRLMELVSKTGAMTFNLCSSDFGGNLSTIGRSISEIFH